jgi:hypothetical protein
VPVTSLYQLPPRLLAALLSPRLSTNKAAASSFKASESSGVAWDSIAQDANAHAVGVLVYQRLVQLGLARHLPANVRAAWQADLLHAKLQHLIQRQDALAVSRSLTAAGIRHAFIKGFAYREWLYDPAWARLGGDVDILIARPDVERARGIVRQHGFLQAAYSLDHKHFRPATAREIAELESSHHELAEFTKDHLLLRGPEWLLKPPFVSRSPFAFGTSPSRPLLHSSIDVHWAVHFVFADAAPLDTTRIVRLPRAGDTMLPVLSREWSILISAFKLYFEAFDRPGYGFNHLVDLIALLEPTDQLDLTVLGELVQRYRLEAAMFYTVSAAQNLAGRILVPEVVLERWREMRRAATESTKASLIDYGDFVPHLVRRRIATDFTGQATR